MSTDLSDIRAYIRLELASTTDWPNATLDAWIIQAIRFYSAEFPKEWYNDISLTTGTQTYSLPAGLQQIISVEYPTGQDPQQFLDPVDEWNAAFQAEDYVYTLLGIDDSTAIASLSGDTIQIKFAQTVTTGETARVRYLGEHALPTAGNDTDEITVPRRHWEAIAAFCRFMTMAELRADEAVTVSTISIVLSQLGQEARDAWNKYKDVMSRLEVLERGADSAVTNWGETLIPSIY